EQSPAVGPAVAAVFLPQLFPPAVLTDGDELHLRGDDALAGVVHLRHTLARPGPQGLVQGLETQMVEARIAQPGLPVLRGRAGELLHVATPQDPLPANLRQPPANVDAHVRI